MNEWMKNEWMNEWMKNEWMNEEWMNEWINERINQSSDWTEGMKNEWMNEWMNEWTVEDRKPASCSARFIIYCHTRSAQEELIKTGY
jgi:hypothetical protein